MAAQALVLMAGALTTWLVATIVGPGIFHQHLIEAGVTHTAGETRHVEEAFSSALLISLVVALLIAVAAALTVSWYFSRRIRASITPVISAASQVASGTYGVRVPDPRLGGEFGALTSTFNALAERLGSVETTRRRMLGDLAHEMRNPLATIDAHLEAVEDGVRDLDPATLRVLRDSTSRLRRLAEDVSAVSRAEERQLPIDRGPVNSDDLALTAAATAGERYSAKGVRLEMTADAHTRINVDAERIGQVLTNLLDNALRHTAPGGTVSLSCRRVGGSVEYAVEDTGVGIPREHLPHVFDRFYRVDTARDRQHGGSGIGLTIARALVEAHGGEISAHSEGPGRGARFVLRLPIVL